MATVALATTGAGGGNQIEWYSPAQPVPVHDEADIFQGPLVDTGWWPSSSDPIAVRFHITPSGTLYTDIDADSELAWPDPLFHRVVAVPDTGRAVAEAAFDVEAELQIDIWGLYTGVIDLFSQGFDMRGQADFDGLLLDGSPTRSVPIDVDGAAVTALEYSFQIFPGLDVVALVDVQPEVELELHDGELTSDVGGTLVSSSVADRWNPVPLGTELPATMETLITWSAQVDGALNAVFTPTVELDTFIGNFQLLALPLDVTVVDVSSVEDADPAVAMHPLPGMEPLTGALDFGEVLMGQERTLHLPVANLGDLILEGDVFVDGDGSFAVYPDTLVARSQESDGLSITFTPSARVAQQAELVIVSNDPLQPEVRVPLMGSGYEPVVEPDPTDTYTPPDTETDGTTTGDDGPRVSGEDAKAGGCGCSGSGPSALPFGVLLLGGLGLRRRRV